MKKYILAIIKNPNRKAITLTFDSQNECENWAEWCKSKGYAYNWIEDEVFQ